MLAKEVRSPFFKVAPQESCGGKWESFILLCTSLQRRFQSNNLLPPFNHMRPKVIQGVLTSLWPCWITFSSIVILRWMKRLDDGGSSDPGTYECQLCDWRGLDVNREMPKKHLKRSHPGAPTNITRVQTHNWKSVMRNHALSEEDRAKNRERVRRFRAKLKVSLFQAWSISDEYDGIKLARKIQKGGDRLTAGKDHDKIATAWI